MSQSMFYDLNFRKVRTNKFLVFEKYYEFIKKSFSDKVRRKC